MGAQLRDSLANGHRYGLEGGFLQVHVADFQYRMSTDHHFPPQNHRHIHTGWARRGEDPIQSQQADEASSMLRNFLCLLLHYDAYYCLAS